MRNFQAEKGKQIVAGFSAINRKDVRPKVKYSVIYRHRNEYPISVMCAFFHISRSGYLKRLEKPERDAELADSQHTTDKTYGYRRVWVWLEHTKIHRNPRTILPIMKKYGLLSEIRRRRKWVNLGQQMHKYDNSIVAYKTASQQTVSLVLETIRLAMKKEEKRVATELQFHSDQGFQYTSQGY